MVPIRKRLTAIVAGVGAVVALSSCALGEAESPEEADSAAGLEEIEPIQLTISDFLPPSGNGPFARQAWMDRVTELTEGKVTFEYHGAATLHPPAEGITALQSGLTDVTLLADGYFPSELPIANWMDQVFAAQSRGLQHPTLNLVANAGPLAVYAKGGPAVEEMASQGFVPIMTLNSLPPVLHCTEPFETPEDLAGRSVRISTELQKTDVGALGMNGVFLPLPEVYEGLQRGVIQCGLNSYGTLTSLGLLDVAPHAAFLGSHYLYGAYYAISAEVWDSLPDVVKDAMDQARVEAMGDFVQFDAKEYKALVESVQEAGYEMIDPAPLDEAIDAAYESASSLASSAPSGVSDPESVVEQVESTFDDVTAIAEKHVDVPEESGDAADHLAPYVAGPTAVDWDGFVKDVMDYVSSN